MVTRYVAGDETDNEALEPTVVDPFDQEYVPPPVAVKSIEVCVQVNSVVAELFVIPAEALVVTVTVCVAVAV